MPVVLEDFGVKFDVLEGEKFVGLDWRKLGEPRNWVKLGCRVGGVRVVRTSQSVIVHPGRLSGFSCDELKLQVGGIIERVRNVLESKFGMVLSEHFTPLHKPIFRLFSKEAEELAKLGNFDLNGVIWSDSSPPEREPHIETTENIAKGFLLSPVRLNRIEERIAELTKNIEVLVTQQNNLLTLLNNLANNGANPSEVKIPDRGLSYVS